jgi:homoprotocatechuate degradation regulator HpaR
MIKPLQTRRSLPMALLRARETIMENFRPMLTRLNVTEQQWRVVRVVAEAGTLDATEVANRASILAPSLTRMIKSLETRKFIKRQKDAKDGRRVMLQITPLGLEFLEKAIPESSEIHRKIEKQFGHEKLNALLDLLHEVTTNR